MKILMVVKGLLYNGGQTINPRPVLQIHIDTGAEASGLLQKMEHLKGPCLI